MGESVFTRAFPYRERKNKSPKENYLIEIFGFCLENDSDFCNQFLGLLNIKIGLDEIKINTQVVDPEFGRPDIEIRINNEIHILIECKVESREGERQLKRYTNILSKSRLPQKHLVYLTKYYVTKENRSDQIELHLLRWNELTEIIDKKSAETTKQFLQFLKDEAMTKVKKFTINDLSVMLNIPSALSKMDEVLNVSKSYFEKKVKSMQRNYASRSTPLFEGYYVDNSFFQCKNYTITINVGFMWWEDSPVPYVGIEIRMDYFKKNPKDDDNIKTMSKFLSGKEKNWDMDDEDERYIYFYAIKLVSEFIRDDEDDIPLIQNYLKQKIDDLSELKKGHPNIFKN